MQTNYGSITDAINHNSPVDNTLGDISTKLLKLSLLCNEIKAFNKSLSIQGRSETRSNLLDGKVKVAVAFIEELARDFGGLSSYAIRDQAEKIRAEKLKFDFQRIISHFRLIQSEIKRRLVLETRTINKVGLDGTCNEISGSQSSTIQVQMHIPCDKTDEVHELNRVLNQEERMRSIEEDVVNVNAIFKQLSELVYDQRSAVDTIEGNIETAYIDQDAGHAQLVKAVIGRQRCRKRCCVFIVIGIIILVITILVLIIEFTPRRS